jgi:[histone H3]-lysine4 N-trimethyltransferase ASH1L
MLFDQNMIIDATRGSIARFVNHSCEPNCRMEKWTVAGKPRMALFAGDKGIMTGDELTYDYNFDPFSQKNVQECRCGSASCRGVLGPKPKEPSKPKEPKDAKSSGLSAAKRKIQQVLDESTSKLNKKRKTIAAVSVKAKYESAKVRTTKKLIKSRAYSSTTGSKKRLVKKASSRPMASAKISVPRPSAAKRLTNAVKKRGSVRMARTASSSSSTVSLVENKPARPPSRRESVKAAASTARKNVVKTVRGATGGRSRTIRPISAGATE